MHNDFGSATPLPAEGFRDEHGNRSIRLVAGKVTYRGFTIVEKHDFGDHGFHIQGFEVKHGYVVTDGGLCNVMPGCAWFLTVRDALPAIDDLINCQDLPRGPGNIHPFWALHRFRQKCEEHAPELVLSLHEQVGVLTQIDGGYLEVVQEGSVEALGDAQVALNVIDDFCDHRSTTIHVDKSRTRNGERLTGRFGILPLPERAEA